jgi:carbonic anhydrase
MDTRIVVEEIFGLRAGDANVVRNAGAVASDDAVRSLILSHRVLGTGEIVVMAHTGCGLRELDDEDLRARLEAETGQTSDTRFGSFTDPDAHVRRQVERIMAHPWIGAVPVHGLVYEVETGRVREIV